MLVLLAIVVVLGYALWSLGLVDNTRSGWRRSVRLYSGIAAVIGLYFLVFVVSPAALPA